MTRKSRQKFTYFDNEKSLEDEIKTIFHHFLRAFIEVNKTILLEAESLTLKYSVVVSTKGHFLTSCKFISIKSSFAQLLIQLVK